MNYVDDHIFCVNVSKLKQSQSVPYRGYFAEGNFLNFLAIQDCNFC